MKSLLLCLCVFLSGYLFGQNVYIPDSVFKSILLSDGGINTNGDSEIQYSEASAYNQGISVADPNGGNMGIYDLTGIEAFTAIRSLTCTNNNLTSLDVSQNTSLIYLFCEYNNLTSLDVSQNNELETFACSNNNLTSLDVSQNIELERFLCENNNLTSLDVSQNNELETFACSNNQLTSLELPLAGRLRFLFCSENQLTSIDVSLQRLRQLYCGNNNLSTLDISNCVFMERLSCFPNPLRCMNLANGVNMNMEVNYGMPNESSAFGSAANAYCVQVDNFVWAQQNWAFSLPNNPIPYSNSCFDDCLMSIVGIDEITTHKKIVEIYDMMGRKTSFRPNTLLIYVYDDGTVENVLSVE